MKPPKILLPPEHRQPSSTVHAVCREMRSMMSWSLLLFSICPFVLLSSAVQGPGPDETRLLKVTIPESPPAVLGGSLTLPCSFTLSMPSPTLSSLGRLAMNNVPRIKWSVLYSGRETEILVARGDRVKINEAYRGRAWLPNYVSAPADLTLRLDDLRHNDTGFYRCEVQQGLEDAHDLALIKVRGVVFHYRRASRRYALAFEDARAACEDIGAHIATPDQLLAAYHSGYEQCDAGWLADGSVRYPIQVPREGCYGDMENFPGVRNYGNLDADELYDVYCYIENIHGEVFHGTSSERFTLAEAELYCEHRGAKLATTGQLYHAWNEGLNHCSPGWLADGSVRYPIVTPRERCGGPEPGVKTVYRYSNQTGFPDPRSHYDVYCFKEGVDSRTVTSPEYSSTEPDDLERDIVTLTDRQEEVSLSHVTLHTESEAQGAVETFSVSSKHARKEPDLAGVPADNQTVYSGDVLTTPEVYGETTDPARSSGQEAQTEPTGYEVISELHLESSYNQTLPVDDIDTENGTEEYTLDFVDLKPYLSPPDSTQEPGEEVEYTTHAERKANATTEHLETFIRQSEAPQHVQPMTDADIDNQTESREDERVTNVEGFPGNASSSVEPYLDHTHTTHPIPLDTTEGSDRDVSTVSTEKMEHLVTQDQDSEHLVTQDQDSEHLVTQDQDSEHLVTQDQDSEHLVTQDQDDLDKRLSDETTTESRLFTNPTPSTSSSEPSNETDIITVTHVDQEPGATSAEWLTTTLTSTHNGSGFRSEGTIITPTYGEGKEAESTDSSGDGYDFILLTLKTTPVPHMSDSSFPPKKTEIEPSVSQEPKTSAPDRSTPSGFSVVEEEVMRVVHPDVKEEPVIYITSTPPATSVTQARHDANGTEDDLSGTEQTYGGVPSVTGHSPYPSATPSLIFTSTDTSQPNTAEVRDFNESGFSTDGVSVGVTRLDGVTATPSRDTPNPTTQPQEFRADVEFSGDSTLITDDPVPPTKTRPTAPPGTETPEEVETPTTLTTTDDLGRGSDEPTTSENSSGRPKKFEIMLISASIQDGCVENPCANGGTCVDNSSGIYCLCLPTYGGEFCQKDLEQCEPGWEKFQGYCYKHFLKRQSWEVAEQHCRMYGGHLISVMSPEEQHFINDKYREYQWTGLNDRTIEGDFRWSDGEPLLYENWYRGQPDSYFLSGENCVVMVWHDEGHWSDVPCNYHLSYTCKKGIAFCGPPPLVLHAKHFGRQRQRFATNTQVRYYCEKGFVQRLNPIITCQSDGQWMRPRITCTPHSDEVNEQQITLPSARDRDVLAKDETINNATSKWWSV